MMQIPSLGKLLVLALVIAGVWLFYKVRGRGPSATGHRGQGRQHRAQDSVALVQCPACQAWYPAQGGCSCGR